MTHRLRFLPLLLLMPLAAAAQDATTTTLAGPSEISLLRMVLALAAVLAVLIGGLWLVKRINVPRGAASSMKILGAVAVGQRERVVMLEVLDTVLVLGVTAGEVNTLHQFPRAQLPETPDNHPGSTLKSATGEFAQRLRQHLERRKS